ncbi:MAG TPA: HAD family hydrolase [Saprospiraceae bacterium]|nr:HAD family hydrolase [Saprospiraceae bacterium]
MKDVKIIAFDADDTLWVNEPHYRKAEDEFCKLLEDILTYHTISKELLKVEIANLSLYGYGAKSFVLSTIETAIKIGGKAISTDIIQKIIDNGKALINSPIELLDGVQHTLEQLHGRYKLIVATKGDLLDQERKLEKSGLLPFFHHVEIVSDKTEAEYHRIIKHLDIRPENFLMIGNSLKSDILPILNIGGHGFHVPYHTTWELEKIDIKIENERFKHLENIQEVLNFI